jgi:uncharacterized phage protein (TIGR01671 family)
MREIKFRAKVLERNQWVYGQYFISPLTDENSNEPIETGMFFLSYPAKPHHIIVQNNVAFSIDLNTLGQYIGQLDINSKEIYEGDVLKTDEANWIAKVIYNYDGFVLTGLNNKGFSCSPSYKNCEIIGNIYEWPETK